MRWVIILWLSAELVLATTAFHLSIEEDIQSHQEIIQKLDNKTDSPIETTNHTSSYAVSGLETDINPEENINKETDGEDNNQTHWSNSDDANGADDSKESNVNGAGVGEGNAAEGEVNISEGNGDNGISEGNGDNGISEGNGDNGISDGNEDNGISDGNGDNGISEDNGDNGEGDDNDDNDDPETGDTTTDSNPESNDHNIIKTTTGDVRGHKWREDASIISYIDIKYGTFKNHFETPIQPERSDSVHDVETHNKRCPQLQDDDVYVGTTDCLTLSIFKPSNAEKASVLVHIHEGRFSQGSGDPNLYGPEYLVSKGVILVLPNYRLGPLGFLCLQNETAPGNAALKDLTLALSWIKDNIEAFGGDPANIAVSGDGTAGALAGYLALSPLAKNYISKVITESGSVLSHWALDRNPDQAATELTKNIKDFKTWQEVDTATLVTAGKNIAFRPCIEKNISNVDHFMLESPSVMINNQEMKIYFMIGSAMYAGIHEYLQHTENSIKQLNENAGLLLPNDLRFSNDAEKTRIGNRVREQYFGNIEISLEDVENLTLYYTDAAYLSPGIRTARPLVTSGATVYFYEFSFVGDLNRELHSLQSQLAQPVEGAVKRDIVGYLFTQDGFVPEETTKERQMIDQLIELWTTFLKSGTPTASNIKWNKLGNGSHSEEEWLSIDKKTILKQGLHDRLRLWTEIYDQYFIERSIGSLLTPSVITVLIAQIVFWIGFFINVSHLY